jgi:ferric-dicitrate binding protein FerR (iron transport regulator)
VGTLLESGRELTLVKGQALITFVNGTQMMLEGPVGLRLDSASEVQLQRGFVATKVPTQAIGFTVSTSLARFVDLGTQFTIRLDADKTFDLYVFEGLVELQLDGRFGKTAHQPLRIAEVRAVHFDASSTEVVALPFNQGEQMPF